MDIIDLKVSKRISKGKESANKLRKAGHVPAILYGKGKNSAMLSVQKTYFKNILEKKALNENSILNLTIEEEGNSLNALLKEIQFDPVSDEVIHLDFCEIDLSKPLDVNVSVKVLNEATCKGVEEQDGTVHLRMRTLRLHALAHKIPEDIEIDVKDLMVNDSVLIKDLPVLEGVTYVDSPDSIVVHVKLRKIVEEEKEAASPEEKIEAKPGEATTEPAKGKAEPAKGKTEPAKGKAEPTKGKDNK
jgi:large subunit ribosomal protein L25